MKKITTKRQKLGSGYIWFFADQDGVYNHVILTEKPHGCGKKVKVNIGKLGGWKKVRLIAEYR